MHACDTRRARLALAFPLALAAGCRFTFDGAEQEVPLAGEPVAVPEEARLNRGPVRSSTVMLGADGGPWVALVEYPNTLHLVPLKPWTAKAERVPLPLTTRIVATYRTLYLVEEDPDAQAATVLRARRPGQPDGEQRFELSPGRLSLMSGGGDSLFAAWTETDTTSDTGSILVARLDGSFTRTVPMPRGDTAAETRRLRGTLLFAGRGDWFVTLEADGHLHAHSTRSMAARDLGAPDENLFIDDGANALLLAGKRGLRRVPIEGGPVLTFEAKATAGVMGFRGRTAVYRRRGEADRVYEVPVDTAAEGGGAAPELVFTGAMTRLWLLVDRGRYAFSLDASDRYVQSAGDGWLDGVRFMERGLSPRVSGDGKRLRFLEHAATTNAAGELRSLPLPLEAGGEAALLATNVRDWAELGDGRLLCSANQAFVGVHNRLILIDESRQVARRFVESARRFRFVPGVADAVLVDLVSGPYGADVALVTLPPAEP